MPLRQCIASHTDRERRVWIARLNSQWNEPGLIEHYIMQLTMQVASILNHKANELRLDQFKIPFKFEKPKPPPSPEEKIKAISQSAMGRWAAWVGLGRKK